MTYDEHSERGADAHRAKEHRHAIRRAKDASVACATAMQEVADTSNEIDRLQRNLEQARASRIKATDALSAAFRREDHEYALLRKVFRNDLPIVFPIKSACQEEVGDIYESVNEEGNVCRVQVTAVEDLYYDVVPILGHAIGGRYEKNTHNHSGSKWRLALPHA